MTMDTTAPKKFKGQLPYRLYEWLDAMAKNRQIRRSQVLLELVKSACHSQVRYPAETREWSKDVRSSSPNNVHFMADGLLEIDFEALKIVNETTSDSEIIRVIVKAAYGVKEKSNSYAATLF